MRRRYIFHVSTYIISQEDSTLILHCELVFGIRVLVAQLLQARKDCILQVFCTDSHSSRTWLKNFIYGL
jgi:hypothetical protein